MNDRSFNPGFRLSTLDVVVLILGLFLGGDLAAVMFWPGMAILFVVGHFFLFCNVVRMDRASELLWAAWFVALSATSILYETPGWPATFATSFAATLLLVAWEVRKPSYHGVLWQSVNPKLPDWWAKSREHAQTS